MGSLRVTLCTGLLAFTALTPAVAHAADGGGVAVTPASPAPGSDIALRISGCAERMATAASAAFVTDARLSGGGGTLMGESRVRTSLEPGTYDVQVVCGSVRLKSAITVVAQPSPQGRPSSPSQSGESAPASAPAAVPASPIAPVPAGGGGTADISAVDVRAAGPGTAQAVTGLVLAGVAAVAVALRSSSRRRRGTD